MSICITKQITKIIHNLIWQIILYYNIFQVGGTISNTIMNAMNTFGRVAVCGSISAYNADPKNLPVGKCFIDMNYFFLIKGT